MIGPRSDVYSLGAVLYCLLTGRPPFQSASLIETLRQVQQQEPVPPSQLNGEVPRDLETVCLKCLEKVPERRYGSAAGAGGGAGAVLGEGEPVRARPVGKLGRGWRWARRNPAVAGLLTAVVSCCCWARAVAWILAGWALDNAAEARDQTRPRDGHARTPTAERRADAREKDARESAQRREGAATCG